MSRGASAIMTAGTSKEVKLATKLADAKAAEKAAKAAVKDADKAAAPYVKAAAKADKALTKATEKVTKAQAALDALKPATTPVVEQPAAAAE